MKKRDLFAEISEGFEALAEERVGKQPQLLYKWALCQQILKIVQESGDPIGFDAGKWLSNWLATPNPALGGVPPGDYMDTDEGRSTVADLLAKMQSGAYS